MILETIGTNADVHKLSRPEIDVLAGEIRDTLVRVCAINGGHLAPNLGVVELTLALHRVLDLPHDKIVWDVSHQVYVHKLLTGRAGRFDTLRQGGGLSGFSMRSESEYDVFGAGHASTSISAALRMAMARDLRGGDEAVVAIIGDGALTGGLAYEAINNAGTLKTNFIVILNDNEMSIAPTSGRSPRIWACCARSRCSRAAARSPRTYSVRSPSAEPRAKRCRRPKSPPCASSIPIRRPRSSSRKWASAIWGRSMVTTTTCSSTSCRMRAASRARCCCTCRTTKGKGFAPAEVDARTFHGVGPNVYSPDEGKLEKKAGRPAFAQAFAEALIDAAKDDEKIIGITAAMPDGTGLAKFAKAFPQRYFDVGIAEAHAVCFAAGAAASGLKPVCAIYSTFLQRAYDQVVHDVVIQELPVVFAIDRAGFVGDDGPTHMGLYDIAYLRTLPGITIMAPRNEHEVAPMLRLALALNAPAAIRYPRGSTSGQYDEPLAPLVLGRAEVLRRGSGVAILALGNTVDAALEACDLVAAGGGSTPTVVNMRFVNPLDEALLIELAETHERFITLEEHSLAGRFGSAVGECVTDKGLKVHLERIGVSNVLVQHNKPERQRAMFGLSAEQIADRVRAFAPALSS